MANDFKIIKVVTNMDERFTSILMAVLVIIFWAVLFPVVNDATAGATVATKALENLSASAKAIVNLVPLVYAFAGPGIAIAIVYMGFSGGRR
jgi:ABC-type Na+ efflux pump permease subunit